VKLCRFELQRISFDVAQQTVCDTINECCPRRKRKSFISSQINALAEKMRKLYKKNQSFAKLFIYNCFSGFCLSLSLGCSLSLSSNHSHSPNFPSGIKNV